MTLVAGFAYQFDLLDQGNGSNPLLGGTLNLVGYKAVAEGSNGDARISFTASSSGTYYLDVSAGASTGSYTLTAQPADDYGDTTTTTMGKLAIGGSTTGVIAPVGDDDLFAVTLVAGFAYQFDLLGQGSGSNTLPGATFSLVNTGKNATAGSSGDARISYTASSSGTYYLDVSAATAGNTGSYTLTAAPVDDYGDTASTTTGKLAIGGSTAGVIAPAGDDDLFAVTLVAGFAYQFDLLGQGSGGNTLPGATLGLVGYGKNSTAGSNGDARISFTASSSGTYYLDVSAPGNTGSYVLIGSSAPKTGTADLAVTSIRAPASAIAGRSITISWTDTNLGDLAATGPWVDQVLVASDATGDNAQLVGSLSYTGTLAGGQSANQALNVTLPPTTSGNEYFIVKTDALNQVANDGVGPERQAVTPAVGVIATAVSTPSVSISSITPTSGSDLGNVTVTVKGANFKADDQVSIVGAGGQTLAASTISYVGAGQLWATFNLTSLPVDAYHVQVGDAASSATSSSTFQVSANPAGQLAVNLVLPQSTTAGTAATGTVTYTNTGATDIAAPILDVSSTQALLEGPGDTTGSGTIEFLGTDPSGPAGILHPGASGTYSFTYIPAQPTVQGDVSLSVGSAQPGATIDWASDEAALQPATVDATDWNNVYTQFEALVGTTTDSLDAALSQAATELSQVGQPTSDVATLLPYELFLASGALAGSDLVGATDISGTSSSLSLLLDRSYDGTLLDRDATGAFGDSWTSTYDVTAITDSSGNVTIQAPGGLHAFTLEANGTYAAQSGDPATLTLAGGFYRMKDGAGDTLQFNAAGKLTSATDGSGNVTSLTYGGNGVLRSVTNQTTGETISFTSNAAGRITSAADSNGQTVSYTYNVGDTLLLSATGPDGTTAYTYAPAIGSAQDNALTSVTNPDGTQQLFTYDAEGRLASQSAGGGTGLTTFSYTGPGAVTVTDALGNQTTELYGSNGTVAQVQDALGNITQLQSKAAGELTSTTTAGGSVSKYGYDSSGNLTSYTDPLGGTVKTSYAAGTPDLTDFTDQRGSQTHYTYDLAGNVTGITYQDGSGDTYAYDTEGLLTSSTDADGNTTHYGFDSAGELTSKSFADGTSDTYAYNAQGDLIAATASGEGTTSYTDDTATRLTSVTNPQGQVVSYTYNAQGQLASRTLPDGSVTQDSYDSDGRLVELQDGSGNLLDHYTYNAAGELVRTDTGNGASTTYQYDADGDTTQILDSNADDSVASEDNYTYDANGLVVQDAGTDGVWEYGYDASGELTTATFASDNPAIQNQSISYVYDAAGNRISQNVNGVVTDYTTNALNEYTAVGGTTYTYDADGNTISETDSGGTTAFTYNKAGELTSETGPSGTYQYAYDALGNVVSTIQNGIVSDYINDPLSLLVSGQPLTSIAQVDGPNGTNQTTYDYGLGLAATTSAGATSFYLSDANGDITGLTGSGGHIQSINDYEPFGTLLYSAGQAQSQFGYSGVYGSPASENGLISMRARQYDPQLGRFLTRDPFGVDGGSNLYRYASNSPADNIDPTGNIVFYDTAGASAYRGGGGGISKGTYVEIDFEKGDINVGNYTTYEFGVGIASSAFAQLGFYSGNLGGFTGFSSQAAIGEGYLSGSTTNNAGGYGIAAGVGLAGGSPTFGGSYTTLNDGGIAYHSHSPLLVSTLKSLFTPILLASVAVIEPAFLGEIASLFPDPHLSTFDGHYYSFQTAGEFVLTRQANGGFFEVQARLSAPIGGGHYSVITELGIQVGTDRVTIDSTRTDAVWVNGVAATFTDGLDTLASGKITQTSSGYVVTLNTGESVTAGIKSVGTQVGPGTTSIGLTIKIALNPFVEEPGTVEGLLGNANGDPSKDLMLADGTVLPASMPSSELYGAYADSWRVTQDTSLLDYGPGQTTATFTDTAYPGQPLTLASFPEEQVQAAEALAAKAGITDPGLQQAAAFDYLVTGATSYFTVEANLQQQGITTAATADITTPTPSPSVGIVATTPTQVESTSGPTAANFELYRSGDTSAALTVTYSVVAPDTTFVGTSVFGGTLPTGTVLFAAGQAGANLQISLPTGIGALASQTLEVQIAAADSTQVIGTTAQVQILNNAPVAGPAPTFAVELVNDQAVMPTVSDTTWTFDLGSASQGAASGTGTLVLAVLNTATDGADSLSGTVTATSDGSIPTIITSSFANVAPSAMFDVAMLDLADSIVAGGTETLTFALEDTNSTGYTAFLPTQTVIISNPAVPCYCPGTLILTDRGDVPVELLEVGHKVITGSGMPQPIVWIGRRSYAGRFLASNPEAWPIRFQASSLGNGLPRRDLLVSPKHAMFLDGLLIPAEHLVNGRTIRRERGGRRVDYIHIELAEHDILWAEGAASESYLDDDNRGMFHNAEDYRSPAVQHAMPTYCAPRVTEGYKLEAIRQRLALNPDRLSRVA